MKLNMCRAKIHRATVTDCNLEYQGSITIGRNMLQASGILPFEMIHINNVTNGNHWETYVIPGEDGQIILNGSPAHHFSKGDIVVIMAFSEISPIDLEDFKQAVVFVDVDNVVTEVETKQLVDYL